MEGLYRIIEIKYGDSYPQIGLHNTDFELRLLGEDSVRAGDRFGFLNHVFFNILATEETEHGKFRFVIQPHNPENFLMEEDLHGAILFKRMSMYSGGTDWGPVRLQRCGNVAKLLKENFGGDQHTIIDTVKEIHKIYESTK